MKTSTMTTMKRRICCMTETNVNKEVTTNPGVTVKMSKLVEGIGTVFIGVLTMLESLDASTAKTFVSGFVGETSVIDGFMSAMSGTPTTPKEETSAGEKTDAEETQKDASSLDAAAEEAEDKTAVDGKAAGATEPAAAVEKTAEERTETDAPATSITADDITKVIVGKIKQNRSNSDKIGSLLKTYGAARVTELPASKYEAFLTDISQL